MKKLSPLQVLLFVAGLFLQGTSLLCGAGLSYRWIKSLDLSGGYGDVMMSPGLGIKIEDHQGELDGFMGFTSKKKGETLDGGLGGYYRISHGRKYGRAFSIEAQSLSGTLTLDGKMVWPGFLWGRFERRQRVLFGDDIITQGTFHTIPFGRGERLSEMEAKLPY